MRRISKAEHRRRLGSVLSMVLGAERELVHGSQVTVDGIALEDVLTGRHAVIGAWHDLPVRVHGAIRIGSLDINDVIDGDLERWLGRAFDDDRDMLAHLVGAVGGDESHPIWRGPDCALGPDQGQAPA